MTYVGTELELFARARRWKAYLRDRLAPYVAGDVLEVGCGLGANAAAFAGLDFASWTGLEPDARLLAKASSPDPRFRFRTGTLGDLDPGARFDAILYIDVLEHIADDAGEAASAAARLRPGGRLIVLAPAHGWLYSPFDRAIGHHRRYTKESLSRAVPVGLARLELSYLDSVGLLASLANRLFLRQSSPTASQIGVWDSVIVPLSRVVDPLTGFRAGKSVLGVWAQRPQTS
ncbi:MAG: class I SAM-dependent methyltransferase [Elusimicrobia bacterium]|nr:class I SAM-dependent methyltransferase [Elusimicrobiota bacterium]